MRKLHHLLDEYEVSHRHPANLAIHWIAEPLAIFALMALLHSVPLGVTTALWPFLAVLLAYFAHLSVKLVVVFLPVVALFVGIIYWAAKALPMQTWIWAAPLFIMCWLALLVGHKIEGRVPSVFQNPNLIFAGPAFLVRILCRKLGLSEP